ncbi:MAG: hypothetical protein ABIH39_06415 [Candidatus Margulisiibacteriota bacterium]
MVQIEKWLKDGWVLYRDNFLNFISIYAIYILAGLVAQKVLMLHLIIMPPLFGSIIIITLQKIRGTEIDVKNMTLGFSFFLPLLISSSIIGLGIFLGMIFFVIPGLIVYALYIFTVPLIVDQKLDFWPAMEASRKKIMEDPFGFIIFGTMLMALIILGVLVLGVGMLLTMPVAINALVYAYIEVFDQKKIITVG